MRLNIYFVCYRPRCTAKGVCRGERAAVSAVRRARLRRIRSGELVTDRPTSGKRHDRPVAQVQKLVRKP